MAHFLTQGCKVVCQSAYILVGVYDWPQLRSAKFQQHFVVSCRIKPNRDYLVLSVSINNMRHGRNIEGKNSGLMG
jgi:hypothetical protein